jgi:hemolysin III
MECLCCREPFNAWSHGLWLLACLPAGLLLLRRSRGDLVKQLGFLVYSWTLIICFAGSYLYHSVWAPEYVDFFTTFDYIGIYALIGGTPTPVALVVLRGPWRWRFLALHWALVLFGVTLRVLGVPMSDRLATGLYIALGWIGFSCYFGLARYLSHRTLSVIWISGIFISGGAILNRLELPVINGENWGHEVFHVCTMIGTFIQFLFLLYVIAPFEHAPELAAEPVPDGLETEGVRA